MTKSSPGRPRYEDVCAVLLTRGDCPSEMQRIHATLPYEEVLVVLPHQVQRAVGDHWEVVCNRRHDLRLFGRWKAHELSSRPVVYMQDDDVLFRSHDALLDAYRPGRLVCNMHDAWIRAQHYHDLVLPGLGSLCDRGLAAPHLDHYHRSFPVDERFYVDADFVAGVLCPSDVVDLGAEVLPAASAPGRLSMEPGQMDGKWRTIRQARTLRRVVLAIMARDEEQVIERALRSAYGLYDSVLLMDTGSLDRTVGVTRRWCQEVGMPLSVMHRGFVDFATNRNALLQAARGQGDYILLMDADEELVGLRDTPGWDHLLADAYFLHYAGDVDYAQPRLLRSWFPWRFQGKVHAALVPEREPAVLDLRRPQIVHHGDDRHGTSKRQRDVEILTAEIEADRDVPRHLFHRAKALEGLGRFAEAMADYRRRIALTDPDEETYYSRFRLGTLLIEHSDDLVHGADQLLTAYFQRPSRVESIRALAFHLTAVADRTPYPSSDMVMVHRPFYALPEPSEEGA